MNFMAIGVLMAVAIMSVAVVVLFAVRSHAETDVDESLRSFVEQQLGQNARQQSDVFGTELDSALHAAEFLARQAVKVFEHPSSVIPEDEVSRFTMSPDGVYYTRDVVKGRASMIYTGAVPITEAMKRKAAQMVALDPALKAVVESNSLAVQAYINTNDSMNRIYPGFDVIAQYPEKMDIPTFNFYYDADGAHNPTRKGVFTAAYIDPAGQGWMTSAIAPVWVNGTLEGVVGVDITISKLVGTLLSNQQSFGAFSVLLDGDNVILAMPKQGERTFGLTELTDYDYPTAVSEDKVKPVQFDLDERADSQELAALLGTSDHGVGAVQLGDMPMLAAWSSFKDPGAKGWRVLTLVPEAGIEQLHEPGQLLKDAAARTLWIVGAAVFAIVALLTLLAHRHSRRFTRPLEAIDRATARIAAGDFEPDLPTAPVAEIDRSGAQLLAMGLSLRDAQAQMLDDAAALRESEQRLRAIFENVADPVVTVDANGIVVDSNDAANATFGVALPGVDVTEIDTEHWREPGRRTISLPVADGSSAMFDMAVSRTGEGDEALYTVTLHDVTAETEARELMSAARATAERTARMKDEFLASMSHEIRTPLNGVIGVLSLLADKDLPDAARHELAVARRSADDLLVLVNDVLDFAKIEAGEVSVVQGDVRVADVIEGVRQLYAPFAAEQGNQLRGCSDVDVPEWVRIDQTRVRQVLVNLVSNALKFTEHGTVDIVARREPGGSDDSFELRFEVSDTGVGIPADVQSRLFTRFSQGDPLAARKYPGTGLGLAITKRLAELMGGRVGLRSAPGEGSTFWFTVRASVGTPAEAVVPMDSLGTAGPLRVLVAEDNEVNRYLINAILDRLGHHVTSVVNGREAVEAAQQQMFDVVLMDVQMPVANGIDATHAIRALPGPASRVPILAVTANVLPEQQEVYRREGFSGWIPKPLTLESVERALASVLPRAARAPIATAPETAPEAEDHFDRELIEQYRSVIGPAGAKEMVELFLATRAERRAELGAAAEAGDVAEVQRIGHALKGMASAVGARALAAIGARLQHNESVDAVPGLLAEFDAESTVALHGLHSAWGLEAV